MKNGRGILAFIAIAVAFMLMGMSLSPVLAQAGAPDRIDLLYFHRTDRCQSCNNAEQFARDTLNTYFPDLLKSGKVTIESIDYQKDKAMAEKYGVNMQGLKMRIIRNGQETIRDMPELWTYVRDKDTYISTLKSALDEVLGK